MKCIDLRDSGAEGNTGEHQGTKGDKTLFCTPSHTMVYQNRGRALTPQIREMVGQGVLPEIAALVVDRLDAADVAVVAAKATGEQQWDEALTRITRRAMEREEGCHLYPVSR